MSDLNEVGLIGIPGVKGGIFSYAETLAHSLPNEGFTVAWQERRELTHAVQPWFPPKCKRFIVTCHDLSPFFSRRERGTDFSMKALGYSIIFKMRVKAAFQKADIILADSIQTAKEVERFIGRDSVVVNLGISSNFKPMPRQAHEKIQVGYGRRSWRKAEKVVSKLDGRAALRPLMGVPANEEPRYYNSLDVFLHLSPYDGFGLPILEAQRCGVPVITLRGARIPEEVARYTTKVEDEEDAAGKVAEYRKIDTTIPLEYSSLFTAEKMAKEVSKVYREVG